MQIEGRGKLGRGREGNGRLGSGMMEVLGSSVSLGLGDVVGFTVGEDVTAGNRLGDGVISCEKVTGVGL